jgi:hypothetical protein
MGTPGAWSTNDPTDDYYYALNTFGPHYWFFVMEMDCGQTQVHRFITSRQTQVMKCQVFVDSGKI